MNRRTFIGALSGAVVGSALAKPVRSSLGADGALKGEKGWQNPYVTNGLIAMWDGEWNAGGGVHDSNAAKWVDLSGNGHDLNCFSVPNWGENGCGVASKDNVFYTSDAAWFRDCWTSSAGVMVEIVLSNCDASGPAFGFGGQWGTWQSWDIQRVGINVVSANARWRTIASVMGDWAYLSQNSWIVRAWANQTDVKVWNDKDTATDSYTYQGYSGNGLAIGSRGDFSQYSSPALLKATYKSVRVYSHQLTAAEIASNSAIDKARFDLP